jgi:hypothetical protein
MAVERERVAHRQEGGMSKGFVMQDIGTLLRIWILECKPVRATIKYEFK